MLLPPPPHRGNRYRVAVTSQPIVTSRGSGVAVRHVANGLTNVSACIYVAFYNGRQRTMALIKSVEKCERYLQLLRKDVIVKGR